MVDYTSDSYKKLFLSTIDEFTPAELKRFALKLKPFLFEEEFKLVVNAKMIIKDLLEKY